jgi:predicted nucleotidyltransferase
MRSTEPPAVLPIFRSRLQADLLAMLYLRPDEEFRARDLVELVPESRPTVFRELARLAGAGLIERRKVGQESRYRAAIDGPLFAPLREMIDSTLGVEAMLEGELARLPGVHAAALFGSWPGGDLRESSDIDLLVIGEPDRHALSEIAMAAGQRAGREVNLSVWSPNDAADALRKDGFLSRVLSGPLRPLVGDVLEAVKP